MEEQQPGATYERQIEKLQQQLSGFLKVRSRLGWIRLIVFLLTLIIAYKIFVTAGFVGLVVVIAGIAALLFLVSRDVNNNQKIKNTRTLIRINEEELDVLRHRFDQRFDGIAFEPNEHDYARDLDLFGKASLFQMINRAYTEQGQQLMAQNFLSPLPIATVLSRQEAVNELAPQLEWRQQLQAFSMETVITQGTRKKTEAWLSAREHRFAHPAWKIFIWIYSLITIGSAIAAITGWIPAAVFSALFLLYFMIAILLSRNTIKPYILLSGIVPEISVLYKLVNGIEEKSFQSPHLQKLQQDIGPDNRKAAAEIRSLKTILDRFDLRLSIAGILFFNPFLLWDVRQMIALNEWQKRNKERVSQWFAVIAEMEVLNSLSTLRFNQPGWSMPGFVPDHFLFEGTLLGHPLIPQDSRVDNDFHCSGKPRIALVTGSNMAGKSTFLRTLGINMVLAYTGAPVCARKLVLSPARLMSSMRIADNLAENTSTFYAELKKLKTIIEAANRHEPVFILLDEILRGTNSYDRHTGSEALIAQLIRHDAVAVIATHDVELARLEESYPAAITNYHFDVQVSGEELYFDYLLKTGVCTSLNASILMKKIGIELNA